jgi:hypothetical protein
MMDGETAMAVRNASRVRTALVAVTLALLSACSSSAPYTVPAAAINTALGLGASAQQRAAGGCFATCSRGRSCNPQTGFCEPSLCGACPAGQSCIVVHGGWQCGTEGEASSAAATIRTNLPPPGQVVPGLGISPRTGSGPPLPAHPGPDQP